MATQEIDYLDLGGLWRNIRLDDTGRLFSADLNLGGRTGTYTKTFKTDTLDLNMFLYNDNGRFRWNWLGVDDFPSTARNISLEMRDGLFGDEIWIKAKLQNSAGEWRDADFRLDQNIHNVKGCFEVPTYLLTMVHGV